MNLPQREIKFRGWDNINNIMFIPTKIDFKNRYVEYYIDGRIRILDMDSDVVLMQYTGRKDKNGEEIWEEDIVIDTLGVIRVVKFNKKTLQFVAEDPLGGYAVLYMKINGKPAYTVIGNVFENPKLLNQGGEDK